MIDLSTLSKSYPYLSLARGLNLDYGDVLLASEIFTINANPVSPAARAASVRLSEYSYDICHVAAAVANGEIGHG